MKHIVGNGLLAPKGVFVQGCNAQGVMGSGIAKEIKSMHPEVFEIYKRAEREKGLKLGSVSYLEVRPDFIIVNGITQEFYGREPGRVYVSYGAIESVFEQAGKLAKEFNLPLIFPLIGSGLGGGDWKVISEIINRVVDSSVEKILYTLEPMHEDRRIVSRQQKLF